MSGQAGSALQQPNGWSPILIWSFTAKMDPSVRWG